MVTVWTTTRVQEVVEKFSPLRDADNSTNSARSSVAPKLLTISYDFLGLDVSLATNNVLIRRGGGTFSKLGRHASSSSPFTPSLPSFLSPPSPLPQ